MPKLENIQDRETLQQTALLLEKTVIRLHKENAKLRAENARLRGHDVDPQMEIELLREQLAAMQHKVFGTSSEKRLHTKDDSSDDKDAVTTGEVTDEMVAEYIEKQDVETQDDDGFKLSE